MNIPRFPHPKINLPKELRNSKEQRVISCFKNLEIYIYLIKDFIYTDINLNYQQDHHNFMHAWIQKTISESLLRSIYLRNSVVDEFNSKNMVGIFLPLKAWLEIVGQLASILDLLERNLPTEDLIEEFKPYALGNRGKGALRTGDVDAKNVMSMFEKADKYVNKMRKDVDNEDKSQGTRSFFTDMYDVVSNPSHPSTDAHMIVGEIITELGIWRGNDADKIREMIVSDYNYYDPTLAMVPVCIQDICKKIFIIEKEHFDKLKSRKYFS